MPNLATGEPFISPPAWRSAAVHRDWADRPHHERAAVLRKAGHLVAEHADEISGWNVREVGTIAPMAGFAIHVADHECYEASSLPGRACGELIPSDQPRFSPARRIPAGVVGVISPFNVPLILGIGTATLSHRLASAQELFLSTGRDQS